MTSTVTESEIAAVQYCSEIADPEDPNAQTRDTPACDARAREASATLPDTLRNRKFSDIAAEKGRQVRADLAGSWMIRNHIPAPADLWAQRYPDRDSIPGGCKTPGSQLLYVTEVCWRTAAVIAIVPVVGILWLLHRASTGIPTVLTATALTALWLIA